MAGLGKELMSEGLSLMKDVAVGKPKVKVELPDISELEEKLEELYPQHTVKHTQSQKESLFEGKPTSTIQEPEMASESVVKQAGTACDICSLDHISTCAGILEEANRFARRDGVGSPEVIRRVSICRQQLNSLERDDANPQKLVHLPPPQREIMEKILPKAGKVRHRLNEIVSLETLEQVTAETQNLSDEFQNAIFHLQVKKELTKEVTLEEAKKLAAAEAAKEVERKWDSQEKK